MSSINKLTNLFHKSKRKFIALGIVFALLVGVSAILTLHQVFADDGGYPYASAVCSPNQVKTYNGVQYCAGDNWALTSGGSLWDPSYGSYGYRNCTDWVAYRLTTNNNYKMPSGAGGASNWGAFFTTQGYAPNSTPAVGSIAWESSGDHVAYVESVSTDGASVTISEYNEGVYPPDPSFGGDGTYDTRTVPTGDFQYIHVKDIVTPPPKPSTHPNPGAVSWGNGRIDVFGQGTAGTGGQIFQQYFSGSSGWSGSWVVPTSGVAGSGPAVSSWGVNRLDVFARGTGGDLIHSYYDGSSWHPWESLGDPSGLTLMPGTNPAAVSWGNGRIDVFIQATDGQMYQDYFTSSGWSGWVQPIPGVVGSGPAVSSWGVNRLDVFARGSAGDLVHAYFDGSWHANLESLGEPSGLTINPHTNPAAVSWGSGRIDVFIQATNGQLYQVYYSGGWSGWAQPVPGVVGSGPAISSWGVNRLDIFSRGSGGDMVHAYYDGSWHASLTSLGGGFM